MLFDTPVYIVFLTVVVCLYWRLAWRAQNVFLLVASYFFYGWWDWRFLGLILLSTVVDFYCAHIIDRSQDALKRKAALTLSLVLNLGFLGVFKYFNFFIDSFASLMKTIGVDVPHSTLRILLPPGISFYTFQEVAYIVDVYFRRLKPASSLVDYALFISLFPHLIAGPIQRPSHLLPQVQKPRLFDSSKFFDGLLLILSGLFRKWSSPTTARCWRTPPSTARSASRASRSLRSARTRSRGRSTATSAATATSRAGPPSCSGFTSW